MDKAGAMKAGAPQIVVEKGTVSNPAPLGLAAFAVITFITSVHNAGWAEGYMWVGLALFNGGLAQFVAGMWEFKNKCQFGATAFSTYGAFWMSQGFLMILQQLDVFPAGFDWGSAFAWQGVAFLIFQLYMNVNALLVNAVIFLAFSFLSLTQICSVVGGFTHSASWVRASGYFGLITAFIVYYGSFAICFNGLAGEHIIPVGGPLLVFKKMGEDKASEDMV